MPRPRPFRSAVPFYVAGRLDYPSELLGAVAERLRLDRHGRVLDLGCGPGFLALGFASLVGAVVAMDPEPEMLAAARMAASRAGRAMTFILGGSEDLGPHLGCFELVTMGRSFHWMDRPRTLAALDRLVVPAGGVALFRDRHPPCPENAWQEVWRDLRRHYGRDLAQRSGGWQEADDGHAAVLRASAFGALEQLTHRFRRRTPVDQVMSRALSLSSCSPEALGAARGAFEADLRAAISRFAVDGAIDEVVEAEALLARRPGA